MALTQSNEMKAGSSAPRFELTDTVTGDTISLEQIRGERGTLIMFICNHCPYVIHTLPQIVKIPREYKASGINSVAISPNDPNKVAQDHPERMTEFALKNDFVFPYLFDESQQTARDYGAVCTPEFYLFDADLKLFYHGRLDESSPGNNKPLTGKELRAALDAMLKNAPAPQPQHPSMGCSIKWK